jgi:DNA-binding NarL/FixJ family response regulator
MSTPLIVLPPDGDPTPAIRKARAAGWNPQRGLSVPDSPWDLSAARHLVIAEIASAEQAAAALLLAVRGAGLLVFLNREAPWAGGFLADLERVGAPAPAMDGPPAIPLSQEQCELLDLLAAGASIASAASSRYISLRTANRRIAEARKALGAASTSEAVVAYSKLRDQQH